jgi:hypothetical protein
MVLPSPLIAFSGYIEHMRWLGERQASTQDSQSEAAGEKE